MSALAVYLSEAGHIVKGSDFSDYYFTVDELNKHNIEIFTYDTTNITNDYIYIIGLSIKKDNVEFAEILNRDLEYYYYNDFIGEFIDKKMIAVSGTHGKTTTTYLINELSDISCIVGCGKGIYNESTYFALEACEYKNHFFSYTPELLVILNIDYDHPDWFKNKKDIVNSFQGICDRSSKVLLNGDDKWCRMIKHSNIYTFGFKNNNNYVIKIMRKHQNGYVFLLKGENLCRILRCDLSGIHNLYNYVGAYLACMMCDLPLNHDKKVSLPFKRLTTYKYGNSILIDDYAHHPTEIKALYEQLKDIYPEYKYNVIFQSHTYSRTLKFRRQFKQVLKKFDKVYMLDVFSSMREGKSMVYQKKVNRYFRCFSKFNEEVINKINKTKNEVWVFLGAGNASEYLKQFKNKQKEVMKIQ